MAHPEPRKPAGTVARWAYLLGLGSGISLGVGSYYGIVALGLEGGWKAAAELLAMGLAMGTAFGIWRWSAAQPLDRDSGEQDREGNDVPG